MDLYSSDFAGIQEGNMRTKDIMDRGQAVIQHNNDIATQISSLKASQTTGNIETAGLQAVQQFWSGGKIPNQITAFQEHLKAGGTLFSNPISQAQSQAQKAVSDAKTLFSNPVSQAQSEAQKAVSNATTGIKGFFTKQEVTAPATPAIQTSEDATAALKTGAQETLEGLGGLGSTALKGLGGITALATGGYDIYKDIDSISQGHGIAGDNWASKTSNILQIGGAIADLGGTVFPPAALLGGVIDVAAGVFGEVGAVKDQGKEEQQDTEEQEKDTEEQEAVSAPQTVATGRVS
jgi:hypothetical protein